MTKIALAEDHQIVRQGLRLLLETESDFSLVGEAADGLEAIRLVERFEPDLLLLDLMLPKLNGVDVTRQLKSGDSKTKILILSMHSEESFIVRAMRSGADGYVLKSDSGVELVKAVRKIISGQRYFSPSISDSKITAYLRRTGQEPVDSYETLSNRERTVLQLIAEGHSSAEIASRLFISPRTVETHRANLMQKLKLHSQTELIRFAIRKRIIAP